MNYAAYISYEGEWVQVNPLGDLSFEVKREGDYIFFRKHLTGEITFVGADYELIRDIPICDEIKIRFVHRNANIDEWYGYFTHTMCAWDLDKCEVIVTPLPDDKYRYALENEEKEHDFFQVAFHTVTGFDFVSYENEIDSKPIFREYLVGATTAPSYTTEANGYTLYRLIYYINETFGYTAVEEWRRDSIRMPLYHTPSIPSYGSQFIYDPVFNSDPNREYDLWIRPYYGGYFQNFITDTGTSGQTRYTLNIQVPDKIVYKNARRLFDCIRYVFRENPFANIASDFFSVTNPISGANLSSDGLFILQASDTKMKSDPATIFKHSWRQISELLADMNVYWDIDDDNNLVIEHRRYFDNGGSYAIPSIVGLDATTLLNKQTGKPYISNLNKYSFSVGDLYEEENIEFAYGKTYQWDLHIIRYNSGCVKKGNINKKKFSLLITDLEAMRTQEDAPNDGIALVNAYLEDGQYKVVYITNPIQPYLVQANGNLSMYNITRWYYLDDRSARDLSIIGNYIAYSVKRVKEQTGLSFPFCAELDTNKLVKTELSEGHIRSYVQNWKKNETTLVLEYEWDK